MIKTQFVDREEFVLSKFVEDTPENADKAFIVTVTPTDTHEVIVVLGQNLCNKLTIAHQIDLGGEYVRQYWGSNGYDGVLDSCGNVVNGDNVKFKFIRTKLVDTDEYPLECIRESIAEVLRHPGNFKVTVEEITLDTDAPAWVDSIDEYSDKLVPF